MTEVSNGVIDEYGIKCYKKLPKDKVVCRSIYDLVTLDPKASFYYQTKIGLKYLLYSEYNNEYQEYIITTETRGNDLLPFIEKGALFI